MMRIFFKNIFQNRLAIHQGIVSTSGMALVLPFLFACTTAPVVKREARVTQTKPKQSAPTKWALWSEGTRLRGVNFWQKRLDPQRDGDVFGNAHIGPPYDAEDFKTLARLGANYVNLSHPGVFTERAPYRIDPNAEKNLDELIRLAKEHNIYVVISFRTGPGRDEAGFDEHETHRAYNDLWKNKDAQTAWVGMWRHVARKYKDHPQVAAYDLMVEPNSNALLLKTDNADEFYSRWSGSLYDWNPLANKILKAIREEDGKTPCIVSAMNYGDPNWLDALPNFDDPYIVYAAHHYAPYEYTHAKPNSPPTYPSELGEGDDAEPFNKDWIRRTLRKVAEFKSRTGRPVVINEYGVFRWQNGALRYLTDEMQIFEEFGVNYAMWLWESRYPKIDYSEFNYRRGLQKANEKDIEPNPLLDLLQSFWVRNKRS